MFNKRYNFIWIILIALLAITTSLFDVVDLYVYLGALALYIFIYMIVLAIKKEKIYKIFCYPLIGAIALYGIINIALMTYSTIDYTMFLEENKTLSEAITSPLSTYQKIFETETDNYYLSFESENIARINKSDKKDMEFYILTKNDEVASNYEYFSPFFDIKEFKDITNTDTYEMHLAFLKDSADDAVLLRIIKDEEIYYSFFVPNDFKSFIKNSNAFEFLKTEGYTDFFVTNPSLTVDMNNTEDSETNKTALLTITEDFIYYSDVLYVEYNTPPDYTTRINNFYNYELLSEIQILEEKLNNVEKNSSEYNEIMEEIDSYNSSLTNHYVELVNESKTENGFIRYYRTYNPYDTIEQAESSTDENTEIETDFDIVSIVEWNIGNEYMIGRTNIDTFELYDY